MLLRDRMAIALTVDEGAPMLEEGVAALAEGALAADIRSLFRLLPAKDLNVSGSLLL